MEDNSNKEKSSSKASQVTFGTQTIGAWSVWNHYVKIKPPDGSRPVKCNCKYCHKELACASEHGTSSLKRHLERCCEYPYSVKYKKQKVLNVMVEDSDVKPITTISTWNFDPAFCRKELARMIVMDELPFKYAEREGFRSFCKALQPGFSPLSRYAVAQDCLELYLEEKKKLKDIFKRTAQRVSLTTEMWTSIQNLGYLCLTAHYIDQDWKLQKRIINFCVVPSSNTGEVIGNAIELCLIDWGLEKLCTITVDNASNNDIAIQNLKRRFNKNNGLLLDGEFFHMRCCAHTLNLIVKKGLQYCGDAISRVRSIVRYVRSSPARSQQFRLCCEQEKIECKKTLCLDVPTHWNSTYLMLQTALECKKAFECLEDRDLIFSMDFKDSLPNAQDWEKVKVLCKLLEFFYNAITRLSQSIHVTANVYFKEIYVIESLLNNWSRSEDAMVRDISWAMKEKFNKYWGSTNKVNIMLVVARVLDPRYKMKYVKFCYSKMYPESKVVVKIEKVRNVMDTLLKYYQMHELTCSKSRVDSTPNPTAANIDDDSEFLEKEFHQVLEEEECSHVESELDHYLLEAVEKDDTSAFDILNWWKVNSTRFVILSKMARDVLSIPVSSVASEFAFSTGGRILDQFRSSLTPKMVEALVCTQDWLQQTPVSIDVEENLDELENIESGYNDDDRAIIVSLM